MYLKDEPDLPGLYVAYINSAFTTKYAERKLLMYSSNTWSYPFSDQRYREHVYACIGPLPIMPLED